MTSEGASLGVSTSGSGILNLKNGCSASNLDIKSPSHHHLHAESKLEIPSTQSYEINYNLKWVQNVNTHQS